MISLSRLGILGINRRNVEIINRLNPRKNFPLVDDKLQTKELCRRAGIPTPGVLTSARSHFELRRLMSELSELSDFVMKPARGAMGNGIIVIVNREGESFVKASGKQLSPRRMQHHASGILAGLYALGGQEDAVIVEERLIVHPELAKASFQGVPDVRVIVYRGYPLMTMVRLPTKASDGRANLHQGAVGLGVAVSHGRGTHAIVKDRPVVAHPDTGERLVGMPIPEFDTVLDIAVKAADEAQLGYLGADVVVDAKRGPMLLELNARPGLSIQLCNQAGLLPLMAAIDREVPTPRSREERIAWSRALVSKEEVS